MEYPENLLELEELASTVRIYAVPEGVTLLFKQDVDLVTRDLGGGSERFYMNVGHGREHYLVTGCKDAVMAFANNVRPRRFKNPDNRVSW
jgi:hypothetical protein